MAASTRRSAAGEVPLLAGLQANAANDDVVRHVIYGGQGVKYN
jgi:hypothetical protein